MPGLDWKLASRARPSSPPPDLAPARGTSTARGHLPLLGCFFERLKWPASSESMQMSRTLATYSLVATANQLSRSASPGGIQSGLLECGLSGQ